MIDAQQLLATARLTTGLDDLGDDTILIGFHTLVDALNSEARLTERGEQSFVAMLTGQLINRLKVEDYLRQHPELLERPIDRPMFVFGLPRTGTTLTINLLAADPARRAFLRWTAFDSVPPPFPKELHAGARYQREQDRLEMSIKYAPQIAAIHYEDADSPCECQFSMSQSFCAQVYESQAQIPSYRKWFLETDYLPAFRFQKRLLQLLQAHVPGRWTLKNPWHPLFLDALTSVYPDAQLVMTHRDPLDVVGSACSLIKHVRVLMSDDVDLDYIGSSMLDTFEIMIARSEGFRAERGQNAIYDIQYADQMRDPIGEMHKLYAHFDEPWTEATETAMRGYMAANPKGRHGKHEYSIEEFGLSKGLIRERFADYCAKYAIPLRD